jgi:hypothetical protein
MNEGVEGGEKLWRVFRHSFTLERRRCGTGGRIEVEPSDPSHSLTLNWSHFLLSFDHHVR